MLWFLPTLFAAEILVLLLIRNQRYSKIFICIWLILLWCLSGCMEEYTDKYYVYIILRIVAASLFVYVGYLSKPYFLNQKNRIWLITLGIYLLLAFFLAEKWTFDLHYAVLLDVLFYYLLGFHGGISVAGIAQIVVNIYFFDWVGKNSLIIMVTHLPIVQAIRTILTSFITDTFVRQILVALVTLVLEILIVWIVNYKFKFLFKFPEKEEVV